MAKPIDAGLVRVSVKGPQVVELTGEQGGPAHVFVYTTDFPAAQGKLYRLLLEEQAEQPAAAAPAATAAKA